MSRRSSGSAAWLFMPSADACAACAAMAGVYDEVPALPVHDDCRWQVQRLASPVKAGPQPRRARRQRR
jgi:hypothetical protein